ncbi:MAG: hypothetical protein WCF92_02175 [bacterium]
MSSIKIISTPPGQAPEWVREKWIGVEIPVPMQALEPGLQMGVKGGKPENSGGYQVNTSEAIEALRKKSPEAAEWWEENVPLAAIPQLVFSKAVCELV